MSGRWTFTPNLHRAWREPDLPDPRQLEALQEMLGEIGNDPDLIDLFLREDWPQALAGSGDPDAEWVGNGITFRVSGDEVIFTPLYDQWGDDVGYVYVPLADVQDLLDQYAAFIRTRRP